MVGWNATTSAITLNVNGPDTSIKRRRLSAWIFKKQDSAICCLREMYFKNKQYTSGRLSSVTNYYTDHDPRSPLHL